MNPSFLHQMFLHFSSDIPSQKQMNDFKSFFAPTRWLSNSLNFYYWEIFYPLTSLSNKTVNYVINYSETIRVCDKLVVNIWAEMKRWLRRSQINRSFHSSPHFIFKIKSFRRFHFRKTKTSTTMLHDQIIYLLGLSSSSDQSISSYLVICGWTFTVLQFFVTVLKPAPYGRHAENASKYLTCKFSIKFPKISVVGLFFDPILLCLPPKSGSKNAPLKIWIGNQAVDFKQRTLTYFVRGSITVQLTSCLSG